MLSRLFYHRPLLSVIDEGTSALDKKNELRFYEAFAELKKSNRNKTSIIIAHRPRALDYCDEVIHLDAGKLSFFGNVDDYKKSPYYKGLFETM